MTLVEVFCKIVEQADTPGDETDHFLNDDLAAYPEEHISALMTLGLLRPGAPARTIVCPACYDEHWEEPESVPGAAHHWFIRCPRFGPQEIDPESLRRHRLDFDALSELLAHLIDGNRSSVPVLPGRMWWLGSVISGVRSADVYFIRGALWADGLDRLDSLALQGILLSSQFAARGLHISGLRVVALHLVLTSSGLTSIGLRPDALVPEADVTQAALDEAHALSDGRPPVPRSTWADLTLEEQIIIDLFPASSAEIRLHLQEVGRNWKPSTVDSARSRVRARLKTLGLGQVLPDGRPSSSGRKRPHL